MKKSKIPITTIIRLKTSDLIYPIRLLLGRVMCSLGFHKYEQSQRLKIINKHHIVSYTQYRCLRCMYEV